MLAKDRGVTGPIIGPSAYFMKSPPVQFSDDAAREMVEAFIVGNGASASADWSNFFDNEASESAQSEQHATS
jgi:myo-inositol-1-phosphate synthase